MEKTNFIQHHRSNLFIWRHLNEADRDVEMEMERERATRADGIVEHVQRIKCNVIPKEKQIKSPLLKN